MQLRLSRYVTGIYGAILLLSLLVFYLFPKKAMLEPDLGLGWAVKNETLRQAAFRGELDRQEGIVTGNRWHFDYPADSLRIVSNRPFPQITVKRTPAGTGEVVAAEYRRETILKDHLRPYRVTLAGNRLNVFSPGEYRLTFTGFLRDITADQFVGRDHNQEESPGGGEWMFKELEYVQQLYLYIPVDIELQYDPDNIFEIGE